MALGGALVGRRLAAQRGDLLAHGSKLIESNPQLKALQGQLTGKLVEVAREAALVAAASRVEALTRSLEARQEPGDEVGAGSAGRAGSAVGGSVDKVRGGLGRVSGRGDSAEESQSESGHSDEESQDEPVDQTENRADESGDHDEQDDSEDDQAQSDGENEFSESEEEPSSSEDHGNDENSKREKAPSLTGTAKRVTPGNVAKNVPAKKSARRTSGKER